MAIVDSMPSRRLVAIGRPWEWLPMPGAARLYVSDEDWKNVASALMAQAAVLMLEFPHRRPEGPGAA